MHKNDIDPYLDSADLEDKINILRETLETTAKNELIEKANKLDVQKFINQYTINRRKLNYLCKLPKELRKYSEGLENILYSKRIMLGKLMTNPQTVIAEQLHAKTDLRIIAKYKLTSEEHNKISSEDIVRLINKQTPYEVIQAWLSKIYKNRTIVQNLKMFVRRFAGLFGNTSWKSEVISHVNTLTNWMNCDPTFYNDTSYLLKKTSKELIEQISTLVGNDYMVIADVLSKNATVEDFISSSALFRKLPEGLPPKVYQLQHRIKTMTKELNRLKDLEDLDAEGTQNTSANFDLETLNKMKEKLTNNKASC